MPSDAGNDPQGVGDRTDEGPEGPSDDRSDEGRATPAHGARSDEGGTAGNATATNGEPEVGAGSAAGPGRERARDTSDHPMARRTRPYGEPGEPLARSPFLFGLTAGLGLVVAYLSYQAVRSIWSILVLVIVSGFLAIGLNPAVVRLQRIGLSRGFAVTVVALAMLLAGCGGLLAVIPPLVSESAEFVDAIPGYLDDLQRARWIREINEQYDVLARLRKALTLDNLSLAAGGLLSGATFVFGLLFNVLTIGILTIYLLGAFDRIKEGAYRFVPSSRRDRARLLGDAILAKVGGYMVGSIAIAALAGVTSLLFMLVTGIPYAMALALVVAICDLIPQIGATLGAVVLTLVGLTVSIPVGIAALIFFIIYQQVENWFIYPRVMRRTTQVSDLAAIISVLLGASLLGVLGVLIAIPATAAVQLIIREVVFPRQDTH